MYILLPANAVTVNTLPVHQQHPLTVFVTSSSARPSVAQNRRARLGDRFLSTKEAAR